MKQVKYDIEISPLKRAIEKFASMLYSSPLNLQLFFVRTIHNEKISNLYWDLISYSYDRVMSTFFPTWNEAIEALVEEYVPEDSEVLDLCCATGITAFAAAKKAKEVTGLDLSPGMLRKAKKKAEKNGIYNVRFAHGDVKERLDFPDEIFDVVTADFSAKNIPHVQDKIENIIKETYRVLKKCGRLVSTGASIEKSYATLPMDEYKDILSKAGYENIEMKIFNDRYVFTSAEKNA